MLRLSREAGLGLLLLSSLLQLQKGKSLGLRQWAEERDLPYRFLSKIAVKMKQAGLIKSKEGRGGGYSLAKGAKRVRLSEVMRVLEGRIKPVRCMRGVRCGVEAECGHRRLMRRLAIVIEQELEGLRLEDLVKER